MFFLLNFTAMNNFYNPPELIQTGDLAIETVEVINLIDSYAVSVDFFYRISKEAHSAKIVHEEISEGKYTRITQYLMNDHLVWTGEGEFDLSKFPKEGIQNLTGGITPVTVAIPGLDKFTKVAITRTATEQHYTIISHLYNQSTLAGFSWEVFELPKILQLTYNSPNIIGVLHV